MSGRPTRDNLLSSTEVADLLGVSATSVKRWSDEGLLPCIKTAGRHRRFFRKTVEQFRDALTGLSAELAGDSAVDAWLAALRREDGQRALEARMLSSRAQLSSWAEVADRLVDVLHTLGAAWSRHELTAVEEQTAVERLERTVERICEWQPRNADAPRALVAAAEGDQHTIGLRLVELGLRELAWNVSYLARGATTKLLVHEISQPAPLQLVALSASAASTNRTALSAEADMVGDACRARGIRLLLGGAGAWPEEPRYGKRVHRVSELRAALA